MRLQQLREVRAVLSKRESFFATVAIVISIASSVLDLIGVAILGIMGSLAISGVGSKEPGTRVGAILRFFNVENWTLQNQFALLGFFAVALLMMKTVLMYFGNKAIYLYFSKQSAKKSAQILTKLLSLPRNSPELANSQDTLYLATGGITNLYLGVVATFITTFSDLALAVLLISALIFVTPSLGITTLVYFSFVGILLFFFLKNRTLSLADQEVKYGIQSNSIILEALRLQRELVVRNTVATYISKTFLLRSDLSSALAMKSLLPNISKYAMEASLTLGVFIIAAIQFTLTDASRAVAALSLFAAAGTRIAPSVLRVQQGALTISASLQMSAPSLEFLRKEHDSNEVEVVSPPMAFNLEDAPPLSVKNLHFRYSKDTDSAINGISLILNKGQSLGIVGISGSGKSTFVDLCLGQLVPDSGEILLYGNPPNHAFKSFPGRIGYVPQRIEIISGSILENVALGGGAVSRQNVFEALEKVGMTDFVEQLPDSLDTFLGENGSRLSGGQKQKIGIARALYTNPEVIFLDEATSALDSESEEVISETIQKLGGQCSLVVIAHRISTLQNLDRIILINNGKIETEGSFKELSVRSETFKRMIEANKTTSLE